MNKLRNQHKDILAIFDMISTKLNSTLNVKTAMFFLKVIKQLGELLEEHLLIEDDFLYPALKKRSNEDVRDIAHKFSIELGGIKESFSDYSTKWTSPENIIQSHLEFVSETKALIGALKGRINKEDEQLFPLYER